MIIRKIFAGIMALLMFLTLSCPSAFAVAAPEVDAAAILVADIDSGNILYEKNMKVSRAPASLTKIMTVLLAVEAVEKGRVQLTDMVTAANDCREGLDESSSSAGIVPGETMSFENLLYCAMVESANEACNVIGSYLEGSIGAFVDKMNERAYQLGAEHTHFNDPNGLSNSDHYSTAYDLYIIAREAIRHPLFMTLCDTDYYQVPATNVSAARDLYNSNALISSESIYGDGYLYEGAHGVKTGYTSLAGYCLISTAERERINLMTIVLGCGGYLNTGESEYGNFVSSKNLYDWAFDNHSYRRVITAGTPLITLDVQYAENNEKAVLCPEKDVELLLSNDAPNPEISIHPSSSKPVAPIAAGTQLGTADVIVDGEVYSTVKLYTSSAVAMAKADYIRARVKEVLSKAWVKALFIAAVIIVAGYIMLMIEYKKMRKKHLKERALAAQRRKAAEEQRRKETEKERKEELARIRRLREQEMIKRIERTSEEPKQKNGEEFDLNQLIESLGLENKQGHYE